MHYYLTGLKLNPHETRAINLRKLRDAQLADFKKNKIPAHATDGSVVWVRASNAPVMGRLVVMQHHKGVASNYDCSLCQCGLRLGSTSLHMSPPSATIVVGGSWQFNAIADMYDCYGSKYPIPVTYSSSWSSSPSSVASVSAGNVTGNAGGTALIQAAYSGCMCWSLIGYCCYCNSQGIAFGSATVTVYDFTVSLSPTSVQPDGIGGSATTTVTVQTSPAASGQSVTLQDVRVANTGGHPANHPLPNSAVTGTFTPSASGDTDSNGRVQRTYKATIFSGNHQIKGTIGSRAQSATLQVEVSGLGQLSGGANYYNSNSPAGQIAHPDNWWGTTATRNGLVAAANACPSDPLCNLPQLPYNDISLVWGGKLDGNSYNWTGGHSEHRVGTSADVNSCNFTPLVQARIEFLLVFTGGAVSSLDECSTPYHTFHFRW